MRAIEQRPANSPAPSPSQSHLSSPQAVYQPLSETSNTAAGTPSLIGAPIPILEYPKPISSLDLVYFELLHNYTTLTCQTLSGDPMLKNVWRINVPRLGFTHEFVMRSIFALSAVHMSLNSLDRSQFFLDLARAEHTEAISQIANTLPNATAENCSAIFIAAALTFLYAWAAPRQPGDFFLLSQSGVAEWVFLLQGIRSISQNWGEQLSHGPLRLMFRLGSQRSNRFAAEDTKPPAWYATNEHIQLTNLRRAVASAKIDTESQALYLDSIDHLEHCFYATAHLMGRLQTGQAEKDRNGEDLTGAISAVPTTSDIYVWIYQMTPEFRDKLQQKDNLTLVIFAHFCVLLNLLNGCWWMQGWPTHLLREIWDNLDEEYRLWITWPTEELGWRP